MKNIKKLTISVVTLIMLISAVSCKDNYNNISKEDESKNTASKTIEIKLDIDFPDDSDIQDVDDLKMNVPKGSSVLEVLNQYGKENDVEILLDEESNTAYVTSINGVAATKTAGWIYEINDEAVMDPADKTTVTKGDNIDWEFTEWTD